MREEGRSLRSSTMNALRSPSASDSHSPGPVERVARRRRCGSRATCRGAGSPIVNGGPVQSGSRQSAPARNEWMVGATGATGTTSSSVACVSASGTDESKTVWCESPATPG